MTSSHFPLRVAAIDAGSNAIRFVAAEFLDPHHWVELEYLRVPVRLGRGAFMSGRIGEEAIEATVEAMATFRRAIDTHGIRLYRAVATSAVRESRNGGDLVERVRGETGIGIETITGSEEARLVWTAARPRVDRDGRPWLMADLGGGSLEISLASAEGIDWIESHTMGTVRLLEDLGGRDRSPAAFRHLAEDYVSTLRIPGRVANEPVAGLLATGGNIETLVDLAGRAPDDQGVSRLSVAELDTWIDRLADMDVDERMRALDLREDRADVILPAAVVYRRVAALADVDEVVVPRVGVKEGVLIDLVEDLIGPGVHADRLERGAFHAALALGRRFRFDEPHARHVTRLGLSLFDQLRSLHGLGHADRRILIGAAVLHDVGQFIGYRRHHKHSLYLIHNSELPSFRRTEVPLVALVARYHRRAEPAKDHYLYADLDEADRERVRRLAALLRIADALDREHLQRVTAVRAEPEGAELVLEMEGRGDLLLEQWSLERKARLFESVFGLGVRPVVPGPVSGPGVI